MDACWPKFDSTADTFCFRFVKFVFFPISHLLLQKIIILVKMQHTLKIAIYIYTGVIISDNRNFDKHVKYL